MKRRISFKLFWAVVWRGIRQVFGFVGKLLGCNGDSSFAKVVWRVFVGCGAVLLSMFTCVMLYIFVTEFVSDELCDWAREQKEDTVVHDMHISNFIVCQELKGKKGSRLYNEASQTVLMEGLDWVVVSEDKDSLAVFSKDHRRGYVNRFTGEVAIQPVYTRAWVFSEGLAAVEHEGKLKFIDHTGKVVIDNNFEVYFNDPHYAFNKGYCIIRDKVTGKFGLIDRNGNWILDPEFDNVHPYGDFVHLTKNDLEGLYKVVCTNEDSDIVKMEEIFPVEYSRIGVDLYDSTILVRKRDLTAAIYDFDLNVVQDFVIGEVSQLEYDISTQRSYIDDDGDEVTERVYAVANVFTYKVGESYNHGLYGLLSKDGRRLTPPIYSDIEAIGKNRYLCLPHGVILDDTGQIVK